MKCLLISILLLSGCFLPPPTQDVYVGMDAGLLWKCGTLELASETETAEGMVRAYYVSGSTYLYYVTVYDHKVISYNRIRQPIYRSRPVFHRRLR